MALTLLDTSFLVDLERELRRNKQGPAKGFLERNPYLPLCSANTKHYASIPDIDFKPFRVS